MIADTRTGELREVKMVTGVDDHSRFSVIAAVTERATSRGVGLALAAALARHGPADGRSIVGAAHCDRKLQPTLQPQRRWASSARENAQFMTRPAFGIEPMTYALREGLEASSAVHRVTPALHTGLLSPLASKVRSYTVGGGYRARRHGALRVASVARMITGQRAAPGDLGHDTEREAHLPARGTWRRCAHYGGDGLLRPG